MKILYNFSGSWIILFSYRCAQVYMKTMCEWIFLTCLNHNNLRINPLNTKHVMYKYLSYLILTYLLKKWIEILIFCHRWWPGEICYPDHVPLNIQDKPHQVGEFPVHFFGSNDYFWVNIGRWVIMLKLVNLDWRGIICNAILTGMQV